MFGSKMYLYKRGQTVISTVRWDTWQCEEKSPQGFYLPVKTSSASRQLLYTNSDPPSHGKTGQERGGEEEKLPFSCSFPPNPPAPSRSGPPSLSTKSRRNQVTKGIWEKRLYQVLILWLFLQFLNFKWEYWNTDIDMKRFIVTIYHYYHRPYCYYRFREFLASAIDGWDGAVSVFSDCS